MTIITLTENQITIAWIAYLVGWFVLFFYVRRWSKKTIKKMNHAHKDNTVTFLTLDDVPGRYVDVEAFECQKPYIEYQAGCN